jgi:hypothetical protein
MTAVTDPTLETPTEPTAVPPPDATPTSSGAVSVVGGLHDVRPENPRRNPITYLALAIATLALLLSLFALAKDTSPDQVDVGGKRCIVDRIEGNDADTLFCQT